MTHRKLRGLPWIACTAFLILGLMIGAAGLAHAAYPERPITVLINASPGGGTDIMARILWKHAESRLGVPVVIENRAGAGGQIAYTALAMSQPDGYTLSATNTMSIVTHELTREGVIYKLKEHFTPVAQVVLDPSAVVVRADSPFETFDQLLEHALANPGSLTWGGTFLWGAHHIHLEMLHQATGAEFTYIPFDGAAETRAALLGGHIDVAAGGLSEYTELIDSGEARALAMGSTQRWTEYPDIPTYRDLGYDIVIGSNRGFSVRAGTPQEIVDRLSDVIGEVMEDPAFLADAERIGIKPTLAYMDSATFTAYLHDLQDIIRALLGK